MRLSPRLRAYRNGAEIAALVGSFLVSFPELGATEFELDLLPSSSWWLGRTDGDRRIPRIRLRPAKPTNPTLSYTIPHELTHLLQRPLRVVPQGERACDIHALARVGERFRIAPSYLRTPGRARTDWGPWAGLARDLAAEALMRRSEGHRTYIAWWEGAFRARVAGPG